MQPLPQLEQCLRLAFEAADPAHPSGISLGSYFVRAPTRGRRRSDLDAKLLFPETVAALLTPQAIERALDASTWRTCPRPQEVIPVATREWLAKAALSLEQAEGLPAMWALLRAVSELEAAAHKLLGARVPKAVVRQVLHGVGMRALRVEPFAAFVVRVFKISQAVYAAFRHAGKSHEAAFVAVQDRLWSPHPTGRRSSSGAEVMGAYLPSLLQAASGHGRRRLRKRQDTHRTQDDARALLARFAAGPGAKLWPWSDAQGRLLPQAALAPETAGICLFLLLTRAASERRGRGVSPVFAEAGFGASDWLPDRTDDVAVRLLAAGDSPPRGELLEALGVLVQASLSAKAPPEVSLSLQRLGVDLAQAEADAMLHRSRPRLAELLRWVEENARELVETA
jgi:hypothetical protein